MSSRTDTPMRHGIAGLRAAVPLLAATALLLTGCAGGGDWPGAPAAPTSAAPAAPDATPRPSAPGDDPDEPTTSPAPPATADSCDWQQPALAAGPAAAPSGSAGPIHDVVVGAWQHTHIDTGDGFETVDHADIRYVFPSADEILYCQDVPGVTDEAEHRAAITWEDTTIVLPGGTVRYTVTDWSDSAMVWRNHLDDSRYLLVRR